MNLIFNINFLYGRHCQVWNSFNWIRMWNFISNVQICCSGNARSHHETTFIRLCGKCADTNIFLVSLCWMGFTGAVYYCRTMSTPSSRAYAIGGISLKVTFHNGTLELIWTITLIKGQTPKIVKAEYNLRAKEFTDAKKKKKGRDICQRAPKPLSTSNQSKSPCNWGKGCCRQLFNDSSVMESIDGGDACKDIMQWSSKRGACSAKTSEWLVHISMNLIHLFNLPV